MNETIATDPEIFRLFALRSALGLELKGFKHSRGSAYAYIKRTYGLRGNKARVYEQFNELVAKLTGVGK